MGKICDYAMKIEDDLFMCRKYNSYCYIDIPDKKQCEEVYGSDYTEELDIIKEDEDHQEESIE